MRSCLPGPCRSCWPTPAAAERKASPRPGACWTHWPPCRPCALPIPQLLWEPGSSRSGCGWAARPAWTRRSAPISTSCGVAWTACPTESGTCWDTALDAALDKLTALPDPEAGSECGVQLMTIHKSKGLEFEVVIVPELQAGSGRGERKMLSWLERGLARPDDSGEITEFLIAPLQPKGADRGTAKAVGRSRLSRARIAGDAAHSLRCRDPRARRAAPVCAASLQGGERRRV